jgi:hypothetical protein
MCLIFYFFIRATTATIGGNSGSGFGDLASVYDSNTDGVIDSSTRASGGCGRGAI